MRARSEGPVLTFPEALQLPLTVDLRTAARAFGICTATAYKLVGLGLFPCPVMRLGRQHRVPTALLLRALGIEEVPLYAADLEAGAGSVAKRHDQVGPFETEDFA